MWKKIGIGVLGALGGGFVALASYLGQLEAAKNIETVVRLVESDGTTTDIRKESEDD